LSLGNVPVTHIIAQHMWWTVVLVGMSTVISFVVGTTIGTLAAWKRGSWLESLLPITTFVQAMPYFFMATLLVLLFSVHFKFFPSVGGYDFTKSSIGLNWKFIKDAVYHGILPALTIVLASLAGWIIGMRNMMVTVRDEDYVLLAEAAGLPKHRVIWYAVRNAVLPQVSSFALALSFVVGGSLLTEIVFSYPGIGFTLLAAVKSLDYSLVQGIFLVITLVVLAANFLADIVYVALDPRTRQEA
jgi:peptide/nickel transport system permease protein